MKRFSQAVVLAFLLLQGCTSPPVQPAPQPPKQLTKLEILIEKEVENVSRFDSPYKEWKDGTISYLGAVLTDWYSRPSWDRGTNSAVNDRGIKILQSENDGARVEFLTGQEMWRGEIAFIEKFTSESNYQNRMFRRDGTYSYLGGRRGRHEREIPKYEMGRSVSREDYLRYQANK